MYVFFFKQKTVYEMRISDWSSDVCSSDLDTPMDEVASVVDVLQTPAFLCRQTDFIHKVASAGKPVNIKKGQFLSPWEMKHVTDKAKATGNQQIMACERGVSFGYNNLVSDMRSLSVMRATRSEEQTSELQSLMRN